MRANADNFELKDIDKIAREYKNIKKYERRIIETRELFLPFAKEVSPYFYKKIKSALRELA